jgi:signal transduction histidine kinase
MSVFKTGVGKAFGRLQKRLRPDNIDGQFKATELLLSSLQTFFERIATEYNTTVVYEPLMVTVRKQDVQPVDSASERAMSAPFCREIVATSFWALTIRASLGLVECFILPATELMTLPNSELPSRAKLTLKLADPLSGSWTVNNVVVSADEMNAIMRGLIKDVISRSKNEFDNMPESIRLVAGGQSFAGSVRSLVAEKHALVQKIVDQQEAIQNQLARELHDSVLGNVMLLKRSMSSSKRMPDEEAIAVLDEIAHRLREVCQDLSPRDLKDCGLQPILEELCRNLEARTECRCILDCPQPIADLPYEVSLHVYRIAQECFNNIVKHASATQAVLSITIQGNVFTMSVSDNGVGFDSSTGGTSRRSKDGGTGAGIIKERTELIGSIFPAKVWIESKPGTGTKMTLEIIISPV